MSGSSRYFFSNHCRIGAEPVAARLARVDAILPLLLAADIATTRRTAHRSASLGRPLHPKPEDRRVEYRKIHPQRGPWIARARRSAHRLPAPACDRPTQTSHPPARPRQDLGASARGGPNLLACAARGWSIQGPRREQLAASRPRRAPRPVQSRARPSRSCARSFWAPTKPLPTTLGLMRHRHRCQTFPRSFFLTMTGPDPPSTVRCHYAVPHSSAPVLTSPSRLVTRVDPQVHRADPGAAGRRTPDDRRIDGRPTTAPDQRQRGGAPRPASGRENPPSATGGCSHDAGMQHVTYPFLGP